MADVFISYHEASAGEIVRHIAAELESIGISCWYARRDLSFGEDFARSIPPEIDNCKVFLLVLNKESAQSEHVLNEVGLAFQRINKGESMLLAPFKVDDYALSNAMRYYLNHFQIISGNPPDANHIQRLVEYVISGIRHQPKLTWTTVYQQQQEMDELKLKISMLEEQIKQLQEERTQKNSSLDVFISYHVSDSSTHFVRNLANKLESMGISCWYAPRNVKPGEFIDSILEALEKCRIFLVILDEGSNSFGYVYNETVEAYNFYKEEGHPVLLPFQVGKFQMLRRLKFYLRPFHIIDGGDSFETADTEELITKITDTLAQL